MINKLKWLIIIASALFGLFAPLAMTASASAQPSGVPSTAKSACSGQECLFNQACQNTQDSSICDQAKSQGTDNPISGPNGVIATAANIIAIFAGVIAVIVIIISGLMYVTAGGAASGQRAGDSVNKAKKAQSTLIGAVVGLVIIALSWTITRFIVDKVIQ